MFLDERIIFEFERTVINEDGIYRYDVLKNDVVIFYGNVFLEANKVPTIDCTDIIRNYVEKDVPPFLYSTTDLLSTFKVRLYIQEQPDMVTKSVFLTYRSPQYKAYVTTPLIEDIGDFDTNTMPMLQGWDYIENKGYFLPTYPKSMTNNFTFDIVGMYQNLPFKHQLSVKYPNNYEDFAGIYSVDEEKGGIGRYSLPLSRLIKGYSVSSGWSTVNFADYFNTVANTTWSEKVVGTTYQLYTKKALPTITNMYFIDSEGLEYEVVDVASFTTTWQCIMALDTKKSKHLTLYIYLDGNHTPQVIEFNRISGNDLTFINVSVEFHLVDEGYLYLYFNTEVSGGIEYTPCDATGIWSTLSTEDDGVLYSYKIANLDGESRWFLKWRDRYGMPQVQAFGGTDFYTEENNYTYSINYKNEKKVIGVSVNPKIELNSRWINEKYMPFYESIFVSPYLQLYDAKEDVLYNVVITNSLYEEKTFKNQGGKQFNLRLELEFNNKQNIIY